MRRVLILLACIIFGQAIFAQVSNGDIPIAVVAAKQQNVPEAVNTYIENKLHQVISQNSLGSSDYQGRFIVTAFIVSATKDILPGPPKQIAENVDITFYIVDMMEHTIFSTTTISKKAVDASEEKALIKAVRSINVKKPQIISFVTEGRNKIVSYYSSHADQIILTAKSLAKQRKYEEALYELCAIPAACGEAYNKAIDAADAIYQEYVDYFCSENLAKAKSAWMAQQNATGATAAGEYLSKIYPDAKCFKEAQSLYEEIKSKVLADWNFEIRKYEDDVALEKQRIQAWRAIGVAYGNHQQPVDYNINWLVR